MQRVGESKRGVAEGCVELLDFQSEMEMCQFKPAFVSEESVSLAPEFGKFSFLSRSALLVFGLRS